MDAPDQKTGEVEEAFKVESPFLVAWEGMKGDDRARKWLNGERMVDDISSRTANEAFSLVDVGRICKAPR